MKVACRIRRVYFDAIVRGEKTAEVRRASEHWRKLAANVVLDLGFGFKPVMVFVCGRDVHRRVIVGVRLEESARAALGREPSEQGRQDIGQGPVIVFELGPEPEMRGPRGARA